ncbi:hypothetical protein BJ875DRAFT_94777 [Amylocarpus encephaloides]|uniref:Uncharacterized protein n=1 Tax=Amylocarpus encephaloides TaxID=45428 RepID=A0A9P7YQS8_9HELO|nr:hypothetical protein BJ875DRAFT_94777 [Amylocarpus encephaloides]
MANQDRHHQRSTSVPHTRLLQSLPPTPLPQLNIPPPQIYLDDPGSAEEDEGDGAAGDIRMDNRTARPSQPPEYQPMHDYLRSKQLTSSNPPAYGSSPSTLQVVTEPAPSLEEPYRDGPFVITIESAPPPPSYYDIFRQHEIELDNMQRALESDSDLAEQTEDIYKWVVAMLLIILTVACVGTAFSWGRPI